MRKKKWLIWFLGLVVTVVVIIFICDAIIRNAAAGKLYNDAALIPYHKTALLLGTSKFLSGGSINPYYSYRIEAAAELIRKGKAKYLVISGDNSQVDYNEPVMMKNDLLKLGIDPSIIYLDYAGFRTFDSMVRLKEIFGQDSVTVISQPFHNERAIYIASREGITAIGYNAKDVNKAFGLQVQVREKLSRVKVFLDYLFGKRPRFLGEKIKLPD
jgi:SanA protein